VILRLYRARVLEGRETQLADFVRDQATSRALTTPGLQSFQPAVRQTPTGPELAIVSTWSGFESLTSVGLDLDSPLTMPELGSMLTEGRGDHYELVIGEARAMPLHPAVLRLTRIPIRANAEAQYYEAVRKWAEQLLDEAGLVAFTLGRRVVGRQDEIVAVQVWQDEAALRAAAGPDVDRPMGEPELSRFWAADPAIEHFDALTAVEARPDAPAMVLVDDNRRYVHATPAAARLAGHPLARLLTMRVDDLSPARDRLLLPALWDRFLVDGSMRGPYVVARADGSEVEVRFAAKANAPWPGSHASVVVPAEQSEVPDELDVDRALVEAGFVARY
jgi:PAS domain-containing protein